MNGLSLDQVLGELNKTASAEEPTKVAAAKETKKVAAAKEDLKAALKRAEDASRVAAEKTASVKAAGPVQELEKVAADLAAADQEALIKEANVYGAAVCDGFMSRLKQYEGAAEGLPEKTASANDVEKIAAEAVRGYIETQGQLKTAAQAEFQRGYGETVQEIQKVANDCFATGEAHTVELLNSLAAK